jgi:putative ABC transport system substrate-binding protein
MARGQQAAVPVIGLASGGTADGNRDQIFAFKQGLGDQGYADGRNMEILYRYAGTQYDRLPALAAELVNRRVAVIAAVAGTAAVVAAKSATTSIPVVFENGSDPVALGIVASLNRPDSNVTGVAFLGQEVTAKRLEVLHGLVPAAKVIGYLLNSASPQSSAQLKEAEIAARRLGVRLVVQNAGTPSDIEEAFANFARQQFEGLVVDTDILFFTQRSQLAALASRYTVPAVYHAREIVEAGGLMSYGANIVEAYRLAGNYTGRVLKGAKVADLPVQQSTRVELVINIQTARSLGLEIPSKMPALADAVIE